tara:strand:- start:20 stop:361 length:342 start_codon:yes stop_codon:yes gene_type:complete
MLEDDNNDLNLTGLEESNSEELPEVVEIDWEDAERIVQLREQLAKTQQGFASFLLDVEKRRYAMMSRCEMLEAEMYRAAEEVQERYKVSNEATYELKLPTQPGEKGYFILKED